VGDIEETDTLIKSNGISARQHRETLSRLDALAVNAQCTHLLQFDVSAFHGPDGTLPNVHEFSFDHVEALALNIH
jgi:hypothetical protein